MLLCSVPPLCKCLRIAANRGRFHHWWQKYRQKTNCLLAENSFFASVLELGFQVGLLRSEPGSRCFWVRVYSLEIWGWALAYHKLRFSCLIRFQRCLDSAHLLGCFYTYLWVKNRCKEMQRYRNPKRSNRPFPELFNSIFIKKKKKKIRQQIWIGVLSKANSLKWFWMEDKIYQHSCFCSSICPCQQLNLSVNLWSVSTFTFQMFPQQPSSAFPTGF